MDNTTPTAATAAIPQIISKSDYSGYFTRLVEHWIAAKAASGTPFKSATIVITAGPWRSYAVAYEIDRGSDDSVPYTLNLDFYSALRTGFGQLTDEDVQGITALL